MTEHAQHISLVEKLNLERGAFRDDIDLIDETLREGAERSSIAPHMEEKYRLGCEIAGAGVRSLVVGMFPDVPHNIELLQTLLRGQAKGEIPGDTRFIIISHVGETFRQTLRVLSQLGEPLDSVWILTIHSVSDTQIRYLFPKIIKKDPQAAWDQDQWTKMSRADRRQWNLDWLDRFLPEATSYQGGGIMMGLLDTFRADVEHLDNAVALAHKHGIPQVRLVDTAGTCIPQQVDSYIAPLIARYPDIGFYCHLHDDFGLSTANAVSALRAGARGVDVSVGGFANRAGHPPLAEVATALYYLYGVTLPGFKYDRLYALSRQMEQTYGLMERAAQPITGVITHGILSGIRTELIAEARDIFDVVEPELVGAQLSRTFGVRSGTDGMKRFLKLNEDQLAQDGVAIADLDPEALYGAVASQWQERSARVLAELKTAITRYQELLHAANFTEEEMLSFIKEQIRNK